MASISNGQAGIGAAEKRSQNASIGLAGSDETVNNNFVVGA